VAWRAAAARRAGVARPSGGARAPAPAGGLGVEARNDAAESFRARREQRARALGYQGLEDFYRRRYRDGRARVDELAAELGCAQSAIRGDLKRLQLGPDRTRSNGARWR